MIPNRTPNVSNKSKVQNPRAEGSAQIIIIQLIELSCMVRVYQSFKYLVLSRRAQSVSSKLFEWRSSYTLCLSYLLSQHEERWHPQRHTLVINTGVVQNRNRHRQNTVVKCQCNILSVPNQLPILNFCLHIRLNVNPIIKSLSLSLSRIVKSV